MKEPPCFSFTCFSTEVIKGGGGGKGGPVGPASSPDGIAQQTEIVKF